MTDETQPPAPPPSAPPIPRFDAPLPPRAAQRLDETTATRHDIAHATRPPWPKYDADKPEPGFKRGKRQCIGRSTQTGKRCRKEPLEKKERCKFHGGRSTGRPPKDANADSRGRARGESRGRYFEAMGVLAKAYEDARADNSLTDTREPLAALDALTRRVLVRAANLDTPDYRKRMLELLEGARDAMAVADAEAFAEKTTAALELAQAGASEDVALGNAVDVLERYSERLEAHWKTKLDRKQAINARDLVLIFQRIVDIVQAEVPGDAAMRVAKAIDTLMLSTQRFDRDAVDVAFRGHMG